MTYEIKAGSLPSVLALGLLAAGCGSPQGDSISEDVEADQSNMQEENMEEANEASSGTLVNVEINLGSGGGYYGYYAMPDGSIRMCLWDRRSGQPMGCSYLSAQ